MNQLRQWIYNKEVADQSRPNGIEYFEEKEHSFMTGISDEMLLHINQDGKCISFTYDGGLALREWLNRLYTNGGNVDAS